MKGQSQNDSIPRRRKTYLSLSDYPESNLVPQQLPQQKHNESCLIWDNIQDTTNPSKWGPSFWYILHNAAAHYPENAAPICAERIKGFILGIPYMLPCKSCSNDAMIYIDSRSSELNDICKSRKSLFDFFYQFHNYVNTKTGKTQLSKESAYKLYKM
jgi:hypothetical protein